ncbi:MAG: DegV family protein [Chloroflexota bacterium]
MRIGLVTDSPADLPEDIIRRYEIDVIPAHLILEGQSYLDGIDITRAEFYSHLPNLKVAPTTATPALGVFSAHFGNMLKNGADHVIGIFTAGKLTSIANNAFKAAEDFPRKVSVIESGSLSMGSGYQVLAAAEAIDQGLSLTAVLSQVQSTRKRLKVFAALDTIEYLRRSGRVPQAVAALGGLLSIKPVVELVEGVVKPLYATRTTGRATEKMLDLLMNLGQLERLSILHTNAEARALDFLSQLSTRHSNYLPADIKIVNVTTVIGTHVGPDGLGFVAVKIEKPAIIRT